MPAPAHACQQQLQLSLALLNKARCVQDQLLACTLGQNKQRRARWFQAVTEICGYSSDNA